MSQNRIIGRVLSVDNFRVFIKIEDDIKGAFKSGINDIYEVARINSYLIIPVGADRIVALITRVTMKEEVELNNSSASIILPSSSRYISATMLGTIAKKDDKEQFIQGVYNFPSLDNPVWYVTEEDLKHIFDDKDNRDEIDYQKDFYLPIGTSPAFQDYKVKICPDQFFVKHAAILGNTGSGKSCTLTSILRNLFRFKYNEDAQLQNAHIVIFDTNGEYKDAFLSAQGVNDELKLINAYYYGGDEEVKVPYWLMNWHDFKYLFNPGEGVQAPVLNRAIGLAKNEIEIDNKGFPSIYIQYIQDIITQINGSAEDYWRIKNYSDVLSGLRGKNFILKSGEKLNDILSTIPDGNSYNKPNPEVIEQITEKLRSFISGMENENMCIQITNEQNIDLPIWFSYQDLCKKFLDAAINQEGVSNNRIAEFMSTLRLRMNSFLNDKRIAIPLMLKDTEEANKNILPQFLALLLGDYNGYFGKEEGQNFIKKYNESNNPNNSNTNQITIIDVSQLPFEVLETVTGILGRIILEFVANFLPKQRGKYPIVIVLEEAQNYIAESKESIAKTVFERIAREGRKYGLSLIVSSQRPSELSKTVLSQCNSFVIHRLQNPEDQKYVRGLISSANADLLEQLPIIPQQHAIITGDCVRTPIQVKIDDVNPTPNSHNPKFISNWINRNSNISDDIYSETYNRWIGKSEKKEDATMTNNEEVKPKNTGGNGCKA
ncbi:MAG: DUF87 domain-containing protein [Bacteroidales bacterium]|nr:DUF87 domain-containing protein [Bacteroidales bacterium]